MNSPHRRSRVWVPQPCIFTLHGGLLNTGCYTVPGDHPAPPPKLPEERKKAAQQERKLVSRLYYQPALTTKEQKQEKERAALKTRSSGTERLSKHRLDAMTRLCQSPLRALMRPSTSTTVADRVMPAYEPEKDKHLMLFWARKKLTQPSDDVMNAVARNKIVEPEGRVVVLPVLF